MIMKLLEAILFAVQASWAWLAAHPTLVVAVFAVVTVIMILDEIVIMLEEDNRG